MGGRQLQQPSSIRGRVSKILLSWRIHSNMRTMRIASNPQTRRASLFSVWLVASLVAVRDCLSALAAANNLTCKKTRHLSGATGDDASEGMKLWLRHNLEALECIRQMLKRLP